MNILQCFEMKIPYQTIFFLFTLAYIQYIFSSTHDNRAKGWGFFGWGGLFCFLLINDLLLKWFKFYFYTDRCPFYKWTPRKCNYTCTYTHCTPVNILKPVAFLGGMGANIPERHASWVAPPFLVLRPPEAENHHLQFSKPFGLQKAIQRGGTSSPRQQGDTHQWIAP